MTTKNEVRSTVEALIMALEALEKEVSMAGGWQSPAEATAITAIKEAMAAVPEAHKQSAEIPQSITCPFCESQHVPGWLHDYNMDRMKKPAPVAEPHKKQSAEQQEPVGEVSGYYERGFTDHKTLYGKLHNQNLPVGAKLYTSPSIETTPLASQSRSDVKPWVHSTTWRGLTDEEINEFFEGMEPNNGFWLSFGRAIEAKLKEKNGF